MAEKIITCSCGQKNRVESSRSDPKCGSCGKPIEDDNFGVTLVAITAIGCGAAFLLIIIGLLWKFFQWAFLH